MPTVTTYEAKARLSHLIAEVERTGRPVTICRHRKPVVDLVPHQEVRDPLEQSPELAGAVFHGDPCRSAADPDWPEACR